MTNRFDNHIHMMEQAGGSFVQALARVYYCADSTNKAKLLAAFPEYFDNYREQFNQYKEAA